MNNRHYCTRIQSLQFVWIMLTFSYMKISRKNSGRIWNRWRRSSCRGATYTTNVCMGFFPFVSSPILLNNTRYTMPMKLLVPDFEAKLTRSWLFVGLRAFSETSFNAKRIFSLRISIVSKSAIFRVFRKAQKFEEINIQRAQISVTSSKTVWWLIPARSLKHWSCSKFALLMRTKGKQSHWNWWSYTIKNK